MDSLISTLLNVTPKQSPSSTSWSSRISSASASSASGKRGTQKKKLTMSAGKEARCVVSGSKNSRSAYEQAYFKRLERSAEMFSEMDETIWSRSSNPFVKTLNVLKSLTPECAMEPIEEGMANMNVDDECNEMEEKTLNLGAAGQKHGKTRLANHAHSSTPVRRRRSLIPVRTRLMPKITSTGETQSEVKAAKAMMTRKIARFHTSTPLCPEGQQFHSGMPSYSEGHRFYTSTPLCPEEQRFYTSTPLCPEGQREHRAEEIGTPKSRIPRLVKKETHSPVSSQRSPLQMQDAPRVTSDSVGKIEKGLQTLTLGNAGERVNGFENSTKLVSGSHNRTDDIWQCNSTGQQANFPQNELQHQHVARPVRRYEGNQSHYSPGNFGSTFNEFSDFGLGVEVIPSRPAGSTTFWSFGSPVIR